MTLLTPTWNDRLRIGLPLIDMQHKQLLDQMDRVIGALRSKKDIREVRSLLTFLDGYVTNHFGYEESCMHLYKCPVAGQNQAAHAHFVQVLAETKQQLETNQSYEAIANRISRDLLNWFVQHIQGIDSKLGPCVNK